MTSTTLYINFLPCYERFCRKCVDGSCTDKERYKACEFSADKIEERAREREMEKSKVTCVKNEGGYEEYKADITKNMYELFDNVKSAYVYFWADNMKEAKDKGEFYFSQKEISDKEFNYDGDKIEIEFNNGKTVCFYNSEWGSISLKK